MDDETLYLKATEEVQHNLKYKAIWAKAMALAYGDLEKAQYIYIDLRVEQLKREKNAEIQRTKVDIVKPEKMQKIIKKPTFNNLGKKRKLFLLFHWIMLLISFFAAQGHQANLMFIAKMVLCFIGLVYVIWLQIAISERNVKQLQWLAIITVFFPFNPVSAFIIWKIAAYSNRELNG